MLKLINLFQQDQEKICNIMTSWYCLKSSMFEGDSGITVSSGEKKEILVSGDDKEATLIAWSSKDSSWGDDWWGRSGGVGGLLLLRLPMSVAGSSGELVPTGSPRNPEWPVGRSIWEKRGHPWMFIPGRAWGGLCMTVLMISSRRVCRERQLWIGNRVTPEQKSGSQRWLWSCDRESVHSSGHQRACLCQGMVQY